MFSLLGRGLKYLELQRKGAPCFPAKGSLLYFVGRITHSAVETYESTNLIFPAECKECKEIEAVVIITARSGAQRSIPETPDTFFRILTI